MSQCSHDGCADEAIPDTTRCDRHTRQHRENAARRRAARKASGVCLLCARPVVPGKARCERHDSCRGEVRCGECREIGHNSRTCQAAIL